ncbi:MAG: hypothetical protein K0S93_1516 [Nitrososphaeraceae archaeon]|jgi:hypothetical protein|nr:hypothetical protein [Nitrososphaeraceae archaeon]
MNELESLLLNHQRKLLVTYKELDLADISSFNQIFILLIEESKGSAGGRGGGSGYRKIDQIIGFRIENKNVKKFYETKEKDLIELFEIPYSAVAMDITLSDGKQIVVQGIIDPDMITNYNNIISS